VPPWLSGLAGYRLIAAGIVGGAGVRVLAVGAALPVLSCG